jgi:predicted peptidase
MKLTSLSIVFAVAACAAPVRRAETPQTGFLDRQVAVDGVTYRYQVYVPQGWTPAQKWPVVLFLHGAGERGDDGLLQTEVGLPSAVRRTPARFPAVIVMPQCRKEAWWNQPAMQAQALRALEQSTQEWNGDPKRVVLTGLSMGGYGTWAIGSRLPGRFAALVPICGGIGKRPLPATVQVPFPGEGEADPYAAVARQIGKTPVWVFHGAKDPTVSVEESRKMVNALKAAGGDVRYTEYPEAGHDSWTAAYRDPELATWLMAKALP